MSLLHFAVGNAALCALNAGWYASDGSPVSLGAAVFSGLGALINTIGHYADRGVR